MGWGMKIVLFFVALFAAAFGGWIIALPILAYLFLPPLLRSGSYRRARSMGPSTGRRGIPFTAIGAVLILLSVIAFFTGGTFSPVVFFTAGMALLLRRRLQVHLASRVRPVEGSILLRSRLNPFRWSAVAEAKVSTRDLERALSGVGERLLLVSDPAPRALLVFSTSSFSRAGAEEQLVRTIQSAARALVPLGVYLLPLDSVEASSATEVRSLLVRPPTDDPKQFVSNSDYGAVTVEAEHGFVTSFALYTRPDKASKAVSLLSNEVNKSPGPITLREFLHEALQKVGSPHPDRYAAFLSSMAATQGETIGQRLTQTEGKGGQVLLVASVGTPQVELTRAQLRAVTRIYE